MHGEDDVIGQRPNQSTLTCNVADSELLVLTKMDFYRTFKHADSSWKNALKHAKKKEQTYILRCQSYLTLGKKVLADSDANYKKALYEPINTNRPAEIVEREKNDRRCEALLERDNKDKYLARFDHRT